MVGAPCSVAEGLRVGLKLQATMVELMAEGEAEPIPLMIRIEMAVLELPAFCTVLNFWIRSERACGRSL
jgi:hypothetical protein